jgi:hypothetical protein
MSSTASKTYESSTRPPSRLPGPGRHGLPHGRAPCHQGRPRGHRLQPQRSQGQSLGREVRRQVRSTPRAWLPEGQDFVMCCVGNDDDLRSVTIGADGAFSRHEAKGAIFVDHTTASAEVARELDAAAAKAGFQFIDAPVSGGQAGAENGALTVMCGGDPAAYDQGRADHHGLRQDAERCSVPRLGPAHQDGQPDLHRRPGQACPKASHFGQEGRARRQPGGRGDLQGRRAVVADGEPRQDHE